jgi:hypothetical protein
MSVPGQEAASHRKVLGLPRSASGDDAELTLSATSGRPGGEEIVAPVTGFKVSAVIALRPSKGAHSPKPSPKILPHSSSRCRTNARSSSSQTQQQ